MMMFVGLVSTVNLRQHVCYLCAVLCLYDDVLCSVICTSLHGRCQSSIHAAKQIKPLLYLLFKTSLHLCHI